VLFTNPGNSVLGMSNFKDTILDDEAMSLLDTDSAPYTASYKPDDPAGLAKLDGRDLYGTWTLQITDTSRNKQVGTLVNWTLIVDYAPIAAPASLSAGTGQQGVSAAPTTDQPVSVFAGLVMNGNNTSGDAVNATAGLSDVNVAGHSDSLISAAYASPTGLSDPGRSNLVYGGPNGPGIAPATGTAIPRTRRPIAATTAAISVSTPALDQAIEALQLDTPAAILVPDLVRPHRRRSG
jgi:hypothetical protein